MIIQSSGYGKELDYNPIEEVIIQIKHLRPHLKKVLSPRLRQNIIKLKILKILRKKGRINLKKKESSTREKEIGIKSSPSQLLKKSPFPPPIITYKKVENTRHRKKDI